jgi:hypothetical protein
VQKSLGGMLKREKAEVTVALKEGTRRCQQRSSSGFALAEVGGMSCHRAGFSFKHGEGSCS